MTHIQVGFFSFLWEKSVRSCFLLDYISYPEMKLYSLLAFVVVKVKGIWYVEWWDFLYLHSLFTWIKDKFEEEIG